MQWMRWSHFFTAKSCYAPHKAAIKMINMETLTVCSKARFNVCSCCEQGSVSMNILFWMYLSITHSFTNNHLSRFDFLLPTVCMYGFPLLHSSPLSISSCLSIYLSNLFLLNTHTCLGSPLPLSFFFPLSFPLPLPFVTPVCLKPYTASPPNKWGHWLAAHSGASRARLLRAQSLKWHQAPPNICSSSSPDQPIECRLWIAWLTHLVCVCLVIPLKDERYNVTYCNRRLLSSLCAALCLPLELLCFQHVQIMTFQNFIVVLFALYECQSQCEIGVWGSREEQNQY